MRKTSQLWTLAVGVMAAASAIAQSDPRVAAETFGNALESGHPERLRQILPKEGKVRLKLASFGPEDGFFGAGQVEALFRNFLEHGSVKKFEVTRVDGDATYALVHARVALVDRDGRDQLVGMQLAFQPEDQRWILREIKELRE